jgi:hypothetical protein
VQHALFIDIKTERDGFRGETDFTIDASFCVVPEKGVYPRGSDLPLDGLHFISRGGTFMQNLTEGRTCWHDSGSLVFCDLNYVDVRKMEEKTKALRAVHRKLDKLTERFGYCDAFAMLARFADVIGAEMLYFRNDREQEIATGEKFRARTRADGLSQVRYESGKLAQALKEVA